jgi:hypothetical protein
MILNNLIGTGLCAGKNTGGNIGACIFAAVGRKGGQINQVSFHAHPH